MPKLSEDWQATIVGLVIVTIIGLGLIGPGPQTIKIEAAPGASASKSALAMSGWSVSATLGEEKAPVTDAYTRLSDSTAYSYVCQDGVIGGAGVDNTLSIQDAQVNLTNSCDAAVALTYKTSNAIPWPLFSIFK